MSQGLTNKQYPTQVDTFSTWENDVDTIKAGIVNDIQDQIRAIETELGTDPAGTVIDLKTRLAVSINDDGTLKQSAMGVTGLQGIQGNTGLQGPQGSTGLEGTSGMKKKTITVTNENGTFAFDFTNQSLTDYADTNYLVYLTPVGSNATKCWAVLSGSKSTTGFTIACMTAGTNGTAPYNATVNGGGNVDIDVITVHL